MSVKLFIRCKHNLLDSLGNNNIYIYNIYTMQIKKTSNALPKKKTSNVLSKNKTTHQKGRGLAVMQMNKNINTRIDHLNNTKKAIDQHVKDINTLGKDIKSSFDKHPITTVALPIGALLLALKFRKPLKKKFDEFLKNSAIRARIEELAIKKYNQVVPINRRRYMNINRDNDPLYIQIYSEIAEKEWAKFANEE